MIRNEQTTLGELSVGDRFYFKIDRHRHVYEVMNDKAIMKAGMFRRKCFIVKNLSGRMKKKMHRCKVVFLRSTAQNVES